MQPFPCTIYKMFCHKFIIWPEYRRLSYRESLFSWCCKMLNPILLYIYRSSICFSFTVHDFTKSDHVQRFPFSSCFLQKSARYQFSMCIVAQCDLSASFWKKKNEKKKWNHSRDIIVRNSIPTKKEESIYWH